MPQFYNDILVVTIEELIPHWYNSLSALNTAIFRAKATDYGIKRVRLGGNGRQMLISYDSLPPHIKNGIADPRKCDHILERYYRIDNEAVTYFSDYQFSDNTFLKQDVQEKYVIDASVLKAAIDLRTDRLTERASKGVVSSKENKPKPIATTIWLDVSSFNKTLLSKYLITHGLPESEKRFKETLKKFETSGYSALISNKHKNQNSRKVTDETQQLLNNMFAGDKLKPSATDVHRRYNDFIKGHTIVVNNETSEIYEPKNFKKLSDTTVKKYMTNWVNRIGSYANRSENRQTLMQQFKPYHSLLKPQFANSLISVDDRNPPFKMPNGKRVWFYNAIDVASGCFTVWVHGESKAGIIVDFYRQMVRQYAEYGLNLPYGIEAESSLNSSFTSTFLKPGAMFQDVRIEANNARGKMIERVYGALRYQYEKQKIGWLARPNARSEKNQPAIEIEKVPTLSYKQIVENSLQDIQKWNNEPHSIHKDKSRWQVFLETQSQDTKPINYRAILPHLGFRTPTSCNAGIVKFNNSEFLLGENGAVSLGEYLISLMMQVEGKQINIYWLDDNEGSILKALIYVGDKYVCEAVKKPTYHRAKNEQTASCIANREIMSSYVATIEAFGKRKKNEIEAVTIIDQRPQPEQKFKIRELQPFTSMPSGGWKEPEQLSDPVDDNYTIAPTRSFVKPLSDSF